jgi:hypothetical protein
MSDLQITLLCLPWQFIIALIAIGIFLINERIKNGKKNRR